MIAALDLRQALLIAAGAAAVYDLRWRIIPNWLTLPLLSAGALLSGARVGSGDLPSEALWAIALSAVVLLMSWHWHLLRGGDVKLFLAGVLFFPHLAFIRCLVVGMLVVAVTWFAAGEGRAGLLRLQALAWSVVLTGEIPAKDEIRTAQARGGVPLAAGLLVGLVAYWLTY
jgi:Flp pilus assembly protein protease CpaA